MNLDEATTGHKLQGRTKMIIVIADYNYYRNWIYVASSRVTTSNRFFMVKTLNGSKIVGPQQALLDQIELLETIETKTLSHLQKNGYFPKDVDVSEGIPSTIRKGKNCIQYIRKQKGYNFRLTPTKNKDTRTEENGIYGLSRRYLQIVSQK